MQCPKCHHHMRTYNRNGVQIEQCDGCRGIFLDYGELEHINQVEAQWYQPGAASHHGHHGQHGRRHGGFGRMFFSS